MQNCLCVIAINNNNNIDIKSTVFNIFLNFKNTTSYFDHDTSEQWTLLRVVLITF